MSENTVVKRTTCAVCGSCCPVDVYVEEGKIVRVEGKQGLCPKGAAARQYVYHPDRILYPMKQIGRKGEGHFERITWEEAYEMMAERLQKVKETYGPESVIFYVGYPKWNRPAALRLANAFGSPNFCTESSTCFQAVDLAWRLNYGGHICMPDLKNAKTVLVWASNPYHSQTPSSRMWLEMKERGVNVISVDPRNTVTCHGADIHMQPYPGTDGALALAMAHVMIEEDLYDKEFIEKYSYGFEEYREYVKTFTPERAEEITGVPKETICRAARLFATEKPSAIKWSASSLAHHLNGVQNHRAIFLLSALTGNYDVKGGNRTMGMPMAPRNEYGKVKRMNKVEAIGQKEFPVWFDISCEESQCTKLAQYIKEEKPYPLKGMVAFGLNHRMWPKPELLNEALGELDFFVNTEFMMSESCRMADLVLPASTPFEREEVMGGMGGRFRMSEKAIEPLGECKNDIEIILELAKRLGLEDEVLGMNYEEYMEHILKPSGLTLEELRKHPEGLEAPNLVMPMERIYEKQPFDTPSGKVEFKSLVLEKYSKEYGYQGLPVFEDFREKTEVDHEAYPFILSVGCRRPQYYHSRTYRLSWIRNLEAPDLIEMHPKDAKACGIEEGDEVTIVSPAGEVTGHVGYQLSMQPGMICMYHGNPNADANELIDLDYVDPISGFPAYKSYFCRVEKRG